jgi:hypothetical protein
MSPIGTYETGVINKNAAEISGYDPGTQSLYVLRADLNSLDILDISDPTNMVKTKIINFNAYGDRPNSIAAKNGIIAVALSANPEQAPGVAVFFDANGNYLTQYDVGPLPDMLTFTPNGDKILVANEGSPDDDYLIDPEGSITIVDISSSVLAAKVTDVGFSEVEMGRDVRIFGPNASPAQDLEPEYITISDDGEIAFVSLQENNAMAIIDISEGIAISIVGLGFKDHAKPENAIDVNDQDENIKLETYPICGMYQPDAIATLTIEGKTYILSANEGDSRTYDGWNEEIRVKDISLDPDVYNPSTAKSLARLITTTTLGDQNGDGLVEQIYSFGGRSFSIWDENINLIWDSGNQFAEYFAINHPLLFNSQGTYTSFDSRSDEKGVEPESITTGVVNGRALAFIGLERTGGIMVYDVSTPSSPDFIGWYHNTNFGGSIEQGTAGDISPEGLIFVSDQDSPTGSPLLIVSHEVSGSVTVYEISH